ncbi:MAG: hypothetical protein DRI97_17025 [Bacteroidetes bacterium]|nr:MAG: hypothetical protein DRI97_17025 [Bacteroidota bacterium]
MAKPIRIYLSQQHQPNIGKWEIYREGKPTGEMVTNATIRKILDRDQYKDFLLGDSIFLIPGERFRCRSHKEKVVKGGRTYLNKRRTKNK